MKILAMCLCLMVAVARAESIDEMKQAIAANEAVQTAAQDVLKARAELERAQRNLQTAKDAAKKVSLAPEVLKLVDEAERGAGATSASSSKDIVRRRAEIEAQAAEQIQPLFKVYFDAYEKERVQLQGELSQIRQNCMVTVTSNDGSSHQAFDDGAYSSASGVAIQRSKAKLDPLYKPVADAVEKFMQPFKAALRESGDIAKPEFNIAAAAAQKFQKKH